MQLAQNGVRRGQVPGSFGGARRTLCALEDELTRLLRANVPSARDCCLVRRVLGWDGQRGSSLKDAGKELGITRERARQVYDQVIEQIKDCNLTASLDEVLALVTRMANRDADDVAIELQRQGLTRFLFPMRALLKTAEVFGRVPDFTVEKAGRKMFVVAGPGVAHSVIKAAQRSTSRCGVQKVSTLCSAIPRIHRRRNDRVFVRQVLKTRGDICWLDAGEETFWLASVPRNPMVRCLKKVICYASPVAVSDVHRALARLPAKQRSTLSRDLLIKFCEQSSFCRVANGCVERGAPLAASSLISDAERLVCRILRRNGNEVSGQRLQSLCGSAGVGMANLSRILLHSPLIFRPAPRIYSAITARSQAVII
jgi:hypothetical protein